ncbi:uncharacterized protein BDZ83DRAFT_124832 [Colletotrichum acutatum]|uniref:Uncharacterized protein n=1 Tax=Glomerella acutata TaxID=27357 RepID=A0AAD8U7E4_GLOAC|nr:uncharacterized protein BDZ83DRAFT_124832 [Colletotrichum acutatum]KAK1710582.1 hypothetical protein BDZ83DRAFT_124832 [Colletotrichum acutatum]
MAHRLSLDSTLGGHTIRAFLPSADHTADEGCESTHSSNQPSTHAPTHRSADDSTHTAVVESNHEQIHNVGVTVPASQYITAAGSDSRAASKLADIRDEAAISGRKRSHGQAFQNADHDHDIAKEIDHDFLYPPVEGPMGGLVYKLEPMDGIKIIANGDIDIFLTMPFIYVAFRTIPILHFPKQVYLRSFPGSRITARLVF